VAEWWGVVSMEKKDYFIISMVALLAVVSIVQAFQIGSLKPSGIITGNAVGGAIDTSGWTETEKMNYEHHGTLPARLQGSVKQSPTQSPTMVGGC